MMSTVLFRRHLSRAAAAKSPAFVLRPINFLCSTTYRSRRRHASSSSSRGHGRHGAAQNNPPGASSSSSSSLEEHQIAQSLRMMRERQYRVVVEVMNACHVDWSSRNLPSRGMLRESATLWMRVLTHADLLSEEALRYQMERASLLLMDDARREDTNEDYRIPVVAVNLHDAETSKRKSVHPIMQTLLGARMLTHITGNKTPKILVCGVPNAGKSSLIHPLTKSRTLSVKKKRGYHLPSINSTAGWTLGMKDHAFEVNVPTKRAKRVTQMVSLVDTPGLRPKLADVEDNEELLATWLAMQGIKPTRGMLSTGRHASDADKAEMLRKEITNVLYGGLARHAEVSSSKFEMESPEDLWRMYSEGGNDSIHGLITSCAEGRYGGMIMEDERTTSIMSKLWRGQQRESSNPALNINQDSTVVGMNEQAELLREIGAYSLEVEDVDKSKIFLPKLLKNRRSGSGRKKEDDRRGNRTDDRRRDDQQNDRLPEAEHDRSNPQITKRDGTNTQESQGNATPSPPDGRNAPKRKGCVTVFIGNLNMDIDKETMKRAIRKTFQDCGKIVSIRLYHKKETGISRGFGLVTFVHTDSTDKAVQLRGTQVMGRPIRIDYDQNIDKPDPIILRLPEHQCRLECMKCAGFIKHNQLGLWRGTYFPRVINWKPEDIRAFYSRMLEAFGGERDNFMTYLMRDSLALTLRSKYRLSSRRKVYKKFKSSDLGGYPVPNEERPWRFRREQPVPLLKPIECTNRSKTKSCRVLEALENTK